MNLFPHKELIETCKNGDSKYEIELDISGIGNVTVRICEVVTLGTDRQKELGFNQIAVSNIGAIRMYNTPNEIYDIWKSNNYFDVSQVSELQFRHKVEEKIGSCDWEALRAKINNKLSEFYQHYTTENRVMQNALENGLNKNIVHSLKNIDFDKQTRIYAYYNHNNVAVFIYKPEKTVYIFLLDDKDRQIQLRQFKKLISMHQGQFWCSCTDKSKVEYVEGYMNVSHGWICRKCRRFVQVG